MDESKGSLWEHARLAVERRDVEAATALGFERCNQCQEWFHRQDDEMVDCAGCGWHCPDCAEGMSWDWCDKCGLVYCGICVGAGNGQMVCALCGIEDLG